MKSKLLSKTLKFYHGRDIILDVKNIRNHCGWGGFINSMANHNETGLVHVEFTRGTEPWAGWVEKEEKEQESKRRGGYGTDLTSVTKSRPKLKSLTTGRKARRLLEPGKRWGRAATNLA